MSAFPSTVDAIALLQELGLIVQEERGDEIYCRCPGHLKNVGRLDHDASWSVNVETGEHYCFSCGYGGTIWWLIATRMEWSTSSGEPDLDRAKKWMNKRGGESLDLVGKLKKTAQSYVKATKRKTMDESRLALFTDPPAEALWDRKISEPVARLLRIHWAPDYEAWVLPIRDPNNGKLWGWQLKGEGENNHVFRNQPSGVAKSKALFGYEVLPGEGTLIVVESPLDVARLHTLGYENAVATYGATWSDEQMDLICRVADRLIVAFDNPAIDPAGRKAALKLMGMDTAGKRIKDARDWSRRIDMAFFQYVTNEKDVGDMDAAAVDVGIATAKSSIRGAKAVLG